MAYPSVAGQIHEYLIFKVAAYESFRSYEVREPSVLKAWVSAQIATLPKSEGLKSSQTLNLKLPEQEFSFNLIAGDASPRKYYRVRVPLTGAVPARSFIAVDAPSSEKTPEFLHIRQLLETGSIRVPSLIAADAEAGFMLLEDLGDDVLLPVLSEHSAGAWYGMALNTLNQLAAIPNANAGLALYDATKLQTELDLFRDWFVPKLLGISWTTAFEQNFSDLSRCLINNALQQPQVVVHRDFHSRNLMVVQNGELAVIDFQDAVLGPITYDPVSLLKDCYVNWPRQRQLSWLLDHKRLLTEQHRLEAVDDDTFVAWFDLMGLQRHIKVLGIFARLSLRDGKPAYLNDLPLVLAYVGEVLAIYAPSIDPLAAFCMLFDEQVLPVCKHQSWYRQVKLT